MGSEAFRDGSAVFGRAAVLSEENERLKAENAELRSAKSAGELRQVLRERDELRAQIEKRGLAHVTATTRIREEGKAQRRALEARVLELEDAVRSRQHVRLQVDLEEARLEVVELRTQLERASTEVAALERARKSAEALQAALEERNDALQARVNRGALACDDNHAAVRKRLVEERDELLREVHELRRELEQAKANAAKRRGLWERLFPSATPSARRP